MVGKPSLAVVAIISHPPGAGPGLPVFVMSSTLGAGLLGRRLSSG